MVKNPNPGLIGEQRRVKLLETGGSPSDVPVVKSYIVGTEEWCQAMEPLEKIIIKRAKLPEGAFGNPLKSPDQIESTTEPGLRGER